MIDSKVVLSILRILKDDEGIETRDCHENISNKISVSRIRWVWHVKRMTQDKLSKIW